MAESATKLRGFLRLGEHERLEDPHLNALVLRWRRVTKVAWMLMKRVADDPG